jgi:hypothetical protein
MVRDLREHLEALMHAFDEAWASIAPSIDPASAENARQNLADAIIAHASTLGTVRNSGDCGHGIRDKPDNCPMIADSV